MSETITTESRPYFECPNACAEQMFDQEGKASAMRLFTENAEIMEDDHFDFTPTGVVHCRICRAVALVKTKTIRTIVTIE